MTRRMAEILAKHTGQPFEQVMADIDRDRFMTPDEALAYGLIDRLVEPRARRGVDALRGRPTRRLPHRAEPRLAVARRDEAPSTSTSRRVRRRRAAARSQTWRSERARARRAARPRRGAPAGGRRSSGSSTATTSSSSGELRDAPASPSHPGVVVVQVQPRPRLGVQRGCADVDDAVVRQPRVHPLGPLSSSPARTRSSIRRAAAPRPSGPPRLEDDLALLRLQRPGLDLLGVVALDEVALERPQLGLLLLAARRLDVRAPRVEAARVRRVRRAREVALEQDRRPRPLDLRIRDRDRREQRDRVRVQRVVVEVVGGRELHDLAEVHDRDPVGDVPDDGEVVRDEEVREVEVAAGAPPSG